MLRFAAENLRSGGIASILLTGKGKGGGPTNRVGKKKRILLRGGVGVCYPSIVFKKFSPLFCKRAGELPYQTRTKDTARKTLNVLSHGA